ncbi:DYNLT2B [Symbiodinium sp. KB8]|nr:DYNLT2B [Symbiodinium sp. KB8]
MKAVLESKLLNEDGSPVPYSAEYTKELAEQIRDELRDLKLPRYKIMVQVVVGQQRGAGVRMGSRCLWDSITDNKASETLVNDNLFAVATAYGVYLY